jgi:hypothetical protein
MARNKRRQVLTMEQVREIVAEVDDFDLPDGAHFQVLSERLGVPIEDLGPLLQRAGLAKPVSP